MTEITLITGDEQTFLLPKPVAIKLKTVENQLKDLGDTETTISLPNVTAPVMEKVLEFVKWHFENPQPGDEDTTSIQDMMDQKDKEPLVSEQEAPKKPKKNAPLCE